MHCCRNLPNKANSMSTVTIIIQKCYHNHPLDLIRNFRNYAIGMAKTIGMFIKGRNGDTHSMTMYLGRNFLIEKSCRREAKNQNSCMTGKCGT